jgi:murein DD-endopeptidase MepM/ murein hydrolase activator NlpD
MPTLQDLVENYGVTEPFGVMGPYGAIHTGVDLGLPSGTPLPAFGEGQISAVFYDPAGGQQVKVKYASGAEGWFAHLSEVYSQVGEQVGANTIIGASGATGHVTGPHLHFEEHDPSGQLVDPLSEAASTYIGGTSNPESDCPPGYMRNVLGICIPSGVPGFNPKLPGVDPITGAGPKAVSGGIAGPGSNLNPFDALGRSVDAFSAQIARGSVAFASTGVMLVAVGVLGFLGIKRVFD